MQENKFWMDEDTFISTLEARRLQVYQSFNWDCSDFVWERFIDLIKECGNGGRSAMDLVDNMIVNGDYGEIQMYVSPEDLELYKDENGDWDPDALDELVEKNGWDCWGMDNDDGDIIEIIVSL